MNPADWSLLGTMLAGFFAIMNPIAIIPIFLGLTDGYSAQARRRVALRSTLVAFGTVAVFTVLGQLIYGYRCNFHFSMRGAVQVLPALALPVPWLSQPLALGALALLGALFFAIARRAVAAFESNRLPLSLRRFW